ncbi:MAG: hypothetical protein ACXVMS_09780 [Flavisolibacter sp.]
MRKALVIVLLYFNVSTGLAQMDTSLPASRKADQRGGDRPPQAVYLQFGGAGLILSGIYDRRFSPSSHGAGFAVGAGFWSQLGISIFTVPVSINYLIGSRKHFLELAAGGTFATASINWFGETRKGNLLIYHANLGYRFQPAPEGFFFRGGISPLFQFDHDKTSFLSGYAGFGYGF